MLADLHRVVSDVEYLFVAGADQAVILGKGGGTIGISAGQMSRLDSVRLAIGKCREARDAEVIDAREGAGGAMVFTTHRHFRP